MVQVDFTRVVEILHEFFTKNSDLGAPMVQQILSLRS